MSSQSQTRSRVGLASAVLRRAAWHTFLQELKHRETFAILLPVARGLELVRGKLGVGSVTDCSAA